MGLDLTAAEVARCFERAAAAAGSASFEQAIEVLASLYAAASGASLEENRRLVGQLLRKGPSAVQLLAFAAETLRQRTDDLHQRYNLSAARLVAALMRNGSGLLRTSPYHLLDLEQALRKELDCDALYAKQLLGMILESGPLSAGVSVQTLRQRTEALVEEFSRELLLGLKYRPLAQLLVVDTTVWQLNLEVWRQYGVIDPEALRQLVRKNGQTLTLAWLRQNRLANLQALQRYLGLSAADVLQQFASYVVVSPQRIVGRPLLLEQQGLLPRLVPDKQAISRQWRRERQLPDDRPAPGEPELISVRDMAKLPDAAFCKLAGISPAVLGAFMAALPSNPAYQALLAEGAAERQRLLGLSPELVRLEAATKERAAAKVEAGEREAAATEEATAELGNA